MNTIYKTKSQLRQGRVDAVFPVITVNQHDVIEKEEEEEEGQKACMCTRVCMIYVCMHVCM